ncbi:hypothetical protein CDCA_CDCA12G3496 [Cyanidium caldarium]|uniref:Probable ATP-dependent transporter ycf16 n=1 Tax=Cyanidium caldarium TaxID=2771 RepID=A0AAV9IZB7_CYACA|nr:hypothetical protein CDCA_CDCA12G3496 [Cyanidium caldarium]
MTRTAIDSIDVEQGVPLNVAAVNSFDTDASEVQRVRRIFALDKHVTDPSLSYKLLLRIVLPFVWPESWRVRGYVALSLVETLLSKALNLFAPIALKNVIDALMGAPLQPAQVHRAVTYTVLYAVSRFGVQLFNDVQRLTWLAVSQAATRSIALVTFAHLHALSVEFHLHRQTGEVLRVMDRGINSLTDLLSVAVFNLLPTLVELLMVVSVFFSMGSAAIALVVFASVLVYAVYSKVTTEWRAAHRKLYNERDNLAESRMVDSLLNYETVKLFAAERREVARYSEVYQALQESERTLQATLGILNSGQSVIICAGVGASMLLATYRVVQGVMTPGDLVMVNAYILQLYQPLRWLGTAYRQIVRAVTDLEKLMRLLANESAVRDVPGAPDLQCAQGEIEFRDVSFEYVAAAAATGDAAKSTSGVRHISFRLPPRGTLAIVGPSGAGKSTLLRLLFRLYDPQHGQILIDGQDVAQVRQESVRRAIGVVAQDTVLFNDTIRYNIAYSVDPEAVRMEDVEAAARAAHIHHFIASLPAGYDTLVGERGLRLSGGEKQRVAIARAILKNPVILALDEATAALDTATEKAIQANLREVCAGRTTVMVAHRLSTVVHADEILVLSEGGEIVERGTHQQLLAREHGRYKEMWAAQVQNMEKETRGEEKTVENGEMEGTRRASERAP